MNASRRPGPVLELRDGGVVEATVGVVAALVEVRGHGGGQHGAADAAGRPVPGEMAHDLPNPRRS
jgi:hypothetical protein